MNSMKLILETWRAHLQEEVTFPKRVPVLLDAGDPRRQEIMKRLFKLVCISYEKIGGHAKCRIPGDLERYKYWIVEDIDEDPEVDVYLAGKPDFGGNKFGLGATDGSEPAATEYKRLSAELRSGETIDGVGNWWGEVSGRPAYASMSRGAPVVEREDIVRKLLEGDAITWHGVHPDPDAAPLFKKYKGWYTRNIGGEDHTKIIVGSPTF